MKLWLDDCRPAPEGYIWAKSVREAELIVSRFNWVTDYLAGHIKAPLTLPWFSEINIDHDAGCYVTDGGNYIEFLKWLENHYPGIKCTFHIHSTNSVEVENMRKIIQRNGWKEI